MKNDMTAKKKVSQRGWLTLHKKEV